ncbi:MAG: quinone-dependent dihydroorotate dehydrogenase [Alphaproteobacteria bacterium]|nr:quinone-dependent dihydroorotate dehydrogenase [Alphaproteobacteria bacterium]
MLGDLAARALRLLPAEAAHRATLALLRRAAPLLSSAPPDEARLAVDALGLSFPNPVGLAAGFDKDAQVPDAMLKLGFGFVECGTITPKPQSGNSRPRLFRLQEDRAVINRMGFNNAGMEAAAARLQRRREHGGVVGINIGANKDNVDRIADYRRAFARLAPLASYVAVNVSSPNTPGLRNLQQRDELERLLGAIMDERARVVPAKPVLLKIAPDLEAASIDEIADVATAAGVQGIIATNTTVARPPGLRSAHAKEQGGLSGAPLFSRSTEVLRQLYRRAGGKLVLIGVGGVSAGADAYAKIRAGASLFQLYTALALQGPGLIPRIKRELLDLMARDGFANISDAIGADAHMYEAAT